MMLLIDLAIRSSVMLALGLLLSACLPARSAALRHRVLASALVAAALVIPFSLWLPEWTVALPARASSVVAVAGPSPAAADPAIAASLPQRAAPRAYSPVVVAWLAGVFIAAAALLASVMRVRRIAARATPIEDRRWRESLDAVASRYGLTRQIAIARTGSPSLLATWGIVRPQVLVPAHALDWPRERVNVVLCHELAHIRRHDWAVQMAAECLRAVLWFNPLAWMACTRLRRESEQACDDEVLGVGVAGREYAAHLIELARQCRRPGSSWVSALPMAHPSTLERRIAAMLNPRVNRGRPTARAMAALAALLMLIALPVAALRAGQAGPAPRTGTLYDATGGVLPGVEVTLIDANDVTWVVTSQASGRFEFPALGPGKYVLEATIRGFRSLRHEFELRSARDWDRAITLQVGNLTETITVRQSRTTLPKELKPVGAGAQPIRVGGNIRAPRKEVHVAPVYPEGMRAAGRSGVVPIEAIIGLDGSVSSVRVVSAQVHPDFAIAAVDAVRQWRFTPTLLNGSPVEVVMMVSVRFDLED